MFAKDSYEAKYQFLIIKRKSTGLKHLNYYKPFIEHLNDMDDIRENIEEYNQIKNRKILIIADMLRNKKLIPILTELSVR